MADNTHIPDPKAQNGIFAEPPSQRTFPVTTVVIASIATVILIVVLLLVGHKDGRSTAISTNAALPLAAYAQNLSLTDIKMSESTSISGGKSTYIDGRITNNGQATVNGVTVQVLFANDQAMPPQIMTVPLNLVRTREPYVDTQPVGAAPLAPGAAADFRLIIEGIGDNWNGQQPQIHITRVGTK